MSFKWFFIWCLALIVRPHRRQANPLSQNFTLVDINISSSILSSRRQRRFGNNETGQGSYFRSNLFIINSKAFIINTMPVTMMCRNMCGKSSIGECFVARRASVLPRFHVCVPNMDLHVISPLNGRATGETNKSYIALLHLGCHQGLQLLAFII